MTAEDRAQFAAWLADSQAEFLALLDATGAEQWTWRPAQGWSIAETAEHIVLSEALLLRGVRRALAAGANPEWEEQTREKTERITRVMAPRKGKAVAPDSLTPRGDWSADQVREQFAAQRGELERFVEGLGAEVYSSTAEHPFPFFGTLNAWQWLIYIPLHTMRHSKQIHAIQTAEGYPLR